MHRARFVLGMAFVLLASAAADAAPVLSLRLQATKSFEFSWTGVPGITHYRLLEDPTGDSGFTQVSPDLSIARRSYEHIVPLHRRLNARYIVQACAITFCVDSNTVHASAPLAEAIGYFKASAVDALDRFGTAIALSSDGTTLAVGAPFEDSSAAGIGGDQFDNSAQDAGAVYVFVRNGSGSSWVQQAYIKASNADVADVFGAALALSADGSRLAVGATGEDDVAEDAGRVYVFARANSVWAQEADLKASNPEEFDHFGSAVSLSGDGRTLAVAAAFEDSVARGVDSDQTDNSAEQSGAVYVWTRSGSGTWSQQAYIKASNTGAGDLFGSSVEVSNDGATLAVGAIGDNSNATGVNGNQFDNSAPFAGAVYVYVRVNSVWTQQAYIKASNTARLDGFGRAVALSGNGAVLAVGASGEDSSATGVNGNQSDELAPSAGAVYVYGRAGSNWSQQVYLKASNTRANDRFGEVVALSNDGAALVVGAFAEDGSAVGIGGDQTGDDAENSGAAYVFAKNNGLWIQRAYVKASNTERIPFFFGSSVALAGNGATLAVGAPFEDGSSPGINGPQNTTPLHGAGAVYVY